MDKTAEVIAVVVLVERDVTSSMERVSVDVLRAGYMSTVLLVGWFNFRSLVLESNESSLWHYTVYRTLLIIGLSENIERTRKQHLPM